MDKSLFNSALPMSDFEKIRLIKINEPGLNRVDSCNASSAVWKCSPTEWNPVQNPAPVSGRVSGYERKMGLSRQIPDLSAGSDSANRALTQIPLSSTSAFADIKRMIDEPEWEHFRQDLSSSDFERIRVATQEPEAFSDEETDFLTCGSGMKNVGKWKRRENSLVDHADSPSPRQKSKLIKTETEQSVEICEPEMDRDSGNLALTPNGLKLRNWFVKTERLVLDSNSNTVCFANIDVSMRIKQEPEQSSVLESSFPTLDCENESRVALNENCDRGIIGSVQYSAVNDRVSSTVSEKPSLKQEYEPLVECPVRDDRASVSSSEDYKSEGCILKVTAPVDITRCSVLNDPVTLIPALNIESVELTTGTEVSKRSASGSGQDDNMVVNLAVQNPTSQPSELMKILLGKPSAEKNKPEVLHAELDPVQKTPNGPKELASGPVLNPFRSKSISSYESDKSKDVRSSRSKSSSSKMSSSKISLSKISRSKPEKVSNKEDSEDDESSPKVSSEDGDSLDEDFYPDEQLSDDDEVEITKSRLLSGVDLDSMTDGQLLDEIIEFVKSTPLFKPFCETELETLAPEVVKHWKTVIGFGKNGLKSVISSYIRQEPKYFNMLKTYVHDGMDEDAIRTLPVYFSYGSERVQLRVKCSVCLKILSVRLFQSHMNIHANHRPHKCEKCGKGYLSEVNLIRHEKESKCSGTEFKCKVCGKTYECKPGLRRHMKSHDLNRKKHTCHLCDAVFALPSGLKDHVARHTNSEDPGQLAIPFQCHVCNKQFITKQLMNRHHSRVHLKKVWQPRECKVCDAKFETKYQYEKHVLLHNKGTEKPLKCPHCDKRFATHQVLKHHIMTHTGEKPHKCDICGHAFTQKVSLRKHMFSHQGRKPYRCDKCGKGSWRKHNIIEHKCPMDKSSEVTMEGDKDPVPAPVLSKAKKLSSSKKKKVVFLSKSNLSNESDKSKDVRRSSCSKTEKVSYKEHSDDEESSLKVSSEGRDSSDEDFKPNDQLSDDEVEDGEFENVDYLDNDYGMRL